MMDTHEDLGISEPTPGEVLLRVMGEIGVGSPDWKRRLDEAMGGMGYGLGWEGDRVTHVVEWGDPP